MGIFTKDIKTMEDLFLHQLEDIYYAEQQLTKAIPKMAEMATNADLKAGLKSHVIDTQNQIERLDKVFAKLGQQPKGTDCPAIDGLIKEANATAGEVEDKAVLDAAIVANSQAVEHYEMSRYGTLIHRPIKAHYEAAGGRSGCIRQGLDRVFKSLRISDLRDRDQHVGGRPHFPAWSQADPTAVVKAETTHSMNMAAASHRWRGASKAERNEAYGRCSP
jgi:ferritin-like metal-binding protein YciE